MDPRKKNTLDPSLYGYDPHPDRRPTLDEQLDLYFGKEDTKEKDTDKKVKLKTENPIRYQTCPYCNNTVKVDVRNIRKKAQHCNKCRNYISVEHLENGTCRVTWESQDFRHRWGNLPQIMPRECPRRLMQLKSYAGVWRYMYDLLHDLDMEHTSGMHTITKDRIRYFIEVVCRKEEDITEWVFKNENPKGGRPRIYE